MSTIPVDKPDNADSADLSAQHTEHRDTQGADDNPLQSSTLSRSSSLEGLAPRSRVSSTPSQDSLRSTRALPPTIRSQRSDESRSASTEPERTTSAHASGEVSVIGREVVRADAERAVARVSQQFSSEEAHVATVTTDLLRGNFEHNPELKAVIESSASAGFFANWQLKTPRAQQNAVARFLLDVVNNNFENKTAMKFASLFNMGAKAGFCVMLMTFARQLESNGMTDDKGFDDKTRAAIGGLVAALPVVLLTAGGVKDFKDGTATVWSSASRGTLALVGATALAVTAALGNLSAAGPSLVAFGLGYCLGRDTSQLFVRTPGQMKGIQFKASLASGIAYGGVEMGVGTAMSYRAGGTSVHADGLRGGINGAGEFMDDVDLTLTHLFKEGMDEAQGNALAKLGGGLSRVNHHFRNRLSLQVPTGKEVANMLLSTYPGRAALFGIVVMAAVNFGVKTPNLDAEKENNYGNLITALILGTLYTAFAGLFAKKDPNARSETDPEAQVGARGGHPEGEYIPMQTPRREGPLIEEIDVETPPPPPQRVGMNPERVRPDSGTSTAMATPALPSSGISFRETSRAKDKGKALDEIESQEHLKPLVDPHTAGESSKSKV